MSDLQAARSYAVVAARELLAESIKHHGRPSPDALVIVDHDGKELLTVFMIDVLPEKIRLLLR